MVEKKIAHSVALWLLWLGVVTAVGYGLFRPQPVPELVRHGDKLEHIVAFAALTFTSWLVLQRYLWRVVAAVVVLALVSEWLQPLISPLRSGCIEDSLANLAGIALALLLVYLYPLVTSQGGG